MDDVVPAMIRSVAVIGSFKQHNDQIQLICSALRKAGVCVTSPQGSEVVKPGVDFVRFHSDRVDASDAAVQSLAIHRILRSELVYVYVPDGYIGRTTCYEVGRIFQAGLPIYFSHQPQDLPVDVPEAFVVSIEELVAKMAEPDWYPSWLYKAQNDEVGQLEQQLRAGILRDD